MSPHRPIHRAFTPSRAYGHALVLGLVAAADNVVGTDTTIVSRDANGKTWRTRCTTPPKRTPLHVCRPQNFCWPIKRM